MKGPRRDFPAKFKARIAWEAATEQQSLSVLSARHELHPNRISAWKRVLIERAEELFDNKQGRKSQEEAELIGRLYQQIGQLQVELDRL